MQAKDRKLGSEPVGKLLRNLAAPAITAQLVNMLYNMVDRIYIGHIPDVGTLALTGVGVCMPIIMVISAFAALVSMGGAPRASIQMGRGNDQGASRIMGNCFMLLLILSLALTGIIFFLRKDLLMLFGASENTIGYAADYLGIYALGTLFVQMSLGMNAFITAQGFATTSMLTVLIGALLNTALDPLFIFAFDMGVKGAALATILSQAVSACWVISFLRGKETTLRLERQYFRLTPQVILPCVALGLSPFIMQATESLIAICFNSSLREYGGDIAVGAMTILTSIMQFSMMPLMGLTQGAQPILSYNYGARNAQRVRRTFSLLLRSSALYAAALWLVVMLTPQTLIRLFTPDRELIDFAVWAVRIYMAVSVLFCVQLSCQQTFIALGNAKASLFLAILRKIALLIPLIYLLPQIIPNQLQAVFLAEPIADFIAVCTTGILFCVQFKRAMAELEAPAQPQ